jgi:LPPG:FO 2-phospho-L-lactate transferase
MIVTLAGGVGAARFLKGLCLVRPPEDLTAVINTADDTVLHGLHISPDIDTVTYSLAGVDNPETGWGLIGETWKVMESLDFLGGITWFQLGDKDLGTHLYRTNRLVDGDSLTTVTSEIASQFKIKTKLLPMTDDKVSTFVTSADSGEEISFQEYFVKLKHSVAISDIRFDGVEDSRPGPEVIESILNAEKIVIAPSNPLVSIGPILAISEILSAVQSRRESTVAISPIVGGLALKGPADRLMRELGHEPSVVGVARLYKDFAGTLVIDNADENHRKDVEALGMRCVVTDTVMSSPTISASLASTVLNVES